MTAPATTAERDAEVLRHFAKVGLPQERELMLRSAARAERWGDVEEIVLFAQLTANVKRSDPSLWPSHAYYDETLARCARVLAEWEGENER